MGIFSRIANKTWSFRSNFFLHHLRRRLKNREFSLITNNCIGGVICHNLNMPFLSPTVNLWIPAEDYLHFLEDLPYYLNCPIEEIHEEGITYPIGAMYKDTEVVRLYFMHYDSFESAVEKWNARAKRVRFDNLYIIMDYPASQDDLQQERIKESFDSLPYEHRILLTKTTGLHGPKIVNLRVYDQEYTPGLILKRKNDFTVKRYLDDFDYVSFLNSK